MNGVFAKLRTGLAAAALASTALAGPVSAQQVKEFWHYLGAGGELEGVEGMMEVAKSKIDEEFTHRVVPGGSAGLRQQVQVSLMGGVPPMAYQVSAGLELNQLAQSGRLVPLTEAWEQINGDEIFPEGLIQVISYGDEKYGLPFAMSMLGNTWYNKGIFEELGLEVPTTWEEWDEVATTLEENGYVALTSGGGSAAWTIYQFYAALFDAAGADGYWEFVGGMMPLDDPRFVEAVDLFEAHFVKYFDDEWTGGVWSDGLDRLMAGEVAMYNMGDWASGYMRQRGWTPNEEYSFFPAPSLQNVTIFQSDVIVVLKGEETDLGMKFAAAAASPEAQQAFNAAKGSIAPSNEIDPSFYDPIAKMEYDKLVSEDAIVLPNLYVLMPSGFKEDLGNAFTRFGATKDRAAFDEELARLEEMRKEMYEAGEFGTF
ncbi:ABC transporter substrate-binding protein [Pseudoruegeria sp. HB172150]|uniref:ABC transporter substrate-binding protein n=1 Tax=Pseudoruegeria sp. HB172150 TaxID=2721164 RepID=UPI001551F0C3|nr:extracellular solute-binding protein [Pseudoruegeria sp. HB172150]